MTCPLLKSQLNLQAGHPSTLRVVSTVFSMFAFTFLIHWLDGDRTCVWCLHMRLVIPYQRVIRSTRQWQEDFFSVVHSSGGIGNTSWSHKFILQFTLWKTKITSNSFVAEWPKSGWDEWWRIRCCRSQRWWWRARSRCPWCFAATWCVTTTDSNSGGAGLQLTTSDTFSTSIMFKLWVGGRRDLDDWCRLLFLCSSLDMMFCTILTLWF
jgi:hypothetical protein